MTATRLHLLGQAALCFRQAGKFEDAGRCAEKAGELISAAEYYQAAGDLVKAADCYRRSGKIRDAVRCMLELGRPGDAAELWREAGSPLDAGWVLAVYAREPLRGRVMLGSVKTGTTQEALGKALRLRIALELCAALDRQPDKLADALAAVEQQLPRVNPASERATLVDWAVHAADEVGRPDLASRAFAAAYRSRLPGITDHWRDWAKVALGGTAGIPDRDLLCRRGAGIPSPRRRIPARRRAAGFASRGWTPRRLRPIHRLPRLSRRLRTSWR
jgi:tetratricopeptide (TPR) repeat protein